MRCELCFYRPEKRCRRNPPEAAEEIGEPAIWPAPEDDDWCGEFLHKDSGKAIKLREMMKESSKDEEETHVDEPTL